MALPVTLKDVSPEFIEALLTYEDRYFYQHPHQPVAIGRAALQDLTSGRIVSGGSTLSMQVARLLDPHDRTLTGKLKQVFRTIQLEWHYSKDEILEMYLNRAPYGGTVEGIGAASWMYLGKPPSELTAGKRHCWRYCRRHRAVCGRIVIRSARKRPVIRCSTGWPNLRCGRSQK